MERQRRVRLCRGTEERGRAVCEEKETRRRRKLPDMLASREGRQSGNVEKEAKEMRTWEGVRHV